MHFALCYFANIAGWKDSKLRFFACSLNILRFPWIISFYNTIPKFIDCNIVLSLDYSLILQSLDCKEETEITDFV